MIAEFDVELGEGRVLHAYDSGRGSLAVFWHHGTPNIGAPPEPLFGAADRLGVRWVSYDRPGYGGSTPCPGRDLASAGTYVARVADVLGIERFAVMGHSGGGSHALACGALLPDRVHCVVSLAGLAPHDAEGLDWYAGMRSPGALRAAAQGREARERYEASGVEFDPEVFTPDDWAALAGKWSWVNDVVRPALEAGPAAQMDDDVAYAAPWGFDPADVVVPVLLVHGDQDRMIPSAHSEWLARRCPSAELWLSPDDGHISILNSAEAALDWLRTRAG